MNTSTASSPRNASMAALPVSPLVAPTMLTRVPERLSEASKSCPMSCMAKSLNASIGPCDDPAKFLVGKGITDERPHHPKRRLLVGDPLQRADILRAHLRNCLRQIEPAIARQPREHRLLEAQNRGCPPRRNIPHCPVPFAARRVRQMNAPVIAAQMTASENHVIAYSR